MFHSEPIAKGLIVISERKIEQTVSVSQEAVVPVTNPYNRTHFNVCVQERLWILAKLAN